VVRSDADASRNPIGFEPVDILFCPSNFSLEFQILTKPLCLACIGRQFETSTLVEVRFDSLGFANGAHLVDGCLDRLAQGGCAERVAFEEVLQAVEQGDAVTAIAPRRAKPSRFALDDRDATRRIGAHQVVGGPQTRESAADDRHVDFAVTWQRRPQFRLRT